MIGSDLVSVPIIAKPNYLTQGIAMSIIRTCHNKENPYVQLNRDSINDTDVSWGAKGLWMYLISKSDKWNVSVANLVKLFQKEKRGCGEKAIYTLLKELVETGYCIRIQHKTSKGLFDTYEYIILEEKKLKETLPISVKGKMDKDPLALKGDAVKGDLTKEESSDNKDVCIVRAAEAAEDKYEEKIIFPGKGRAILSIKETILRFNLYREGFTEREIMDAIDKVKAMKKRPALSTTIEKYIAGIILKTRKQDEIDKAIAHKKRKEKKASPFDLPENNGVAEPQTRLTPEQIKDIFYPKNNEEQK
jgi:hypothetical protein